MKIVVYLLVMVDDIKTVDPKFSMSEIRSLFEFMENADVELTSSCKTTEVALGKTATREGDTSNDDLTPLALEA